MKLKAKCTIKQYRNGKIVKWSEIERIYLKKKMFNNYLYIRRMYKSGETIYSVVAEGLGYGLDKRWESRSYFLLNFSSQYFSHIFISLTTRRSFLLYASKNGLMITYTELGAARYCFEFKKGHQKKQQRLSIAKPSELRHNFKMWSKILSLFKVRHCRCKYSTT